MVDRVKASVRSHIMRQVRTKDTGPELAVRKLVFRLGGRYRLHVKNLPGHPDLVFPGRKKVLFVHGCYWHGHGCRWGRLPRSNTEYWNSKIALNRLRDERQQAELRGLGWTVEVVWQCELKNPEKLELKLTRFLGRSAPPTTK